MKGGCKGGKPGFVRPPHGATASHFPQQVSPQAPGKGGGLLARSAAGASEVGRLLASADLGNFEMAIKRLGVESAADLKYVTQQDLTSMHMTVIQRRKFDELVAAKAGGGPARIATRERSRSRGRRDSRNDRERRDKGDGKSKGKDRDGKGDDRRGSSSKDGKSGKGSGGSEAKGFGKGSGSEAAKPTPWALSRPSVPKAAALPKTEIPKAPWHVQQMQQQAAPLRAGWAASRPSGVMPKAGTTTVVPPPRIPAPKAPAGPPSATSRLGNEDAVKEAERRLRENGLRKLYWEEVAKLKRDYKLSEKVELALKLLEATKLNALLRESGDLPRMLQHSPDKDKLIRSLVARQDTAVDQIVTRLEQKETHGKGSKSSGGDAKGDGKGWRQNNSNDRGGYKKSW